MPESVDVLIVGAGLSGVGAAAQLTRERPGSTYVVLEARAAIGGTWDLFRYPGIRSDSDMYTMGYHFKPWLGEESLASGPDILDYVRETAREYDVEGHLRLGHRVTRAEWSSADARWTVEAEHAGKPVAFTARFLWCCSGYYDYDRGHRPDFPGEERFGGTFVHPQQWPADLDHAGRRVVVIGSGATAVTLVPELAKSAASVTMLQRSPSYVVSLPGRDPVALTLRRRLPEKAAHRAIRWKNILIASLFYRFARRWPGAARGLIRKGTIALLPAGYDVDTHFRPAYDVWDQRVCFVPDADLFRSIGRGGAEVVTDTIETFDQTGIVLTSGRHLDADIVVTATGLELQVFGGVDTFVDGAPVDPTQQMAYRALMLSGMPNFAFTIGYTNASWTLKADLVAEYVCRLLDHLDASGARSVVPVRDPSVGERPLMDFQPGYVLRALDRLPHQGDREPWMLRQNYLRDARTLRRAPLDDTALRFS
ncbi:MAG: flavin-containing monooxygenase [Nocardioides sp.]